jgi:hypothetical protein
MKSGYARKAALAAIVVVTAATGLGAGSATANLRNPEYPETTIGPPATAPEPVTAPAAVVRVLVSLGRDRRCDGEIFAVRMAKRQSTPFC